MAAAAGVVGRGLIVEACVPTVQSSARCSLSIVVCSGSYVIGIVACIAVHYPHSPCGTGMSVDTEYAHYCHTQVEALASLG